MPFGKYRGTAMINVPAVYLMWLFDQGCTHDGVKRYILDNKTILEAEARKAKR